jgi:hypothetical protein
MALSKIQTGLVDANVIGATELSSPLNLSSKTLNISNVNNTFPAGHVVQTVYNSPGTTIQISLGSSSTPSFTEFHSSYRITITPKFSNSILKLTWDGMIGGRNQSGIISLKFYDQTNSSNVGSSTLGTGSLRTFCNATLRTQDSDTNDRHPVTMSAYQAASNTTARTYGIYGAKESNQTFDINMTDTDNAGCSYVTPNFTIQEIAQ